MLTYREEKSLGFIEPDMSESGENASVSKPPKSEDQHE